MGRTVYFTHLNGGFLRSFHVGKYIYHILPWMPAACRVWCHHKIHPLPRWSVDPWWPWWPYPLSPVGAPPWRQPAALSGGYRIPEGYVVSADPTHLECWPQATGHWRGSGGSREWQPCHGSHTKSEPKCQSTTKMSKEKIAWIFFWGTLLVK